MIIHRSSENMKEIENGQIEMICTSPPYWGPDCEQDLLLPRPEQQDYDGVSAKIRSYAEALLPIYREMQRILHPNGVVVLQIKDLRYGPFSIPLSDWHSAILHNIGLRLLGRVNWIPVPVPPERRPGFLQGPKRGNWRPLDPEVFLVLTTANGVAEPRIKEAWRDVIADEAQRSEWVRPLWQTSRGRWKNNHPHAAPNPPVRRLLKLFTEPGDWVADPFAGGGNMLKEAQKLGRRIIGYEIEERWVIASQKLLGLQNHPPITECFDTQTTRCEHAIQS